jgi:hypothetical protein
MQYGTVEMVPLEWLLNNLFYSADGFYHSDGVWWESLMEEKAGDCHFGMLVNAIVTEGFRVPICVYKSCGTWGLGNGHHRMTAAILLALNEIPVYWSDEDYMATHATSTEGLGYDSGEFEDIETFAYGLFSA